MTHSVKVAAFQVPEIRENLEESLLQIETCVAKADLVGARMICFPECFLQGYLLDEQTARRHALDLTSPAFAEILLRLAPLRPVMVIGVIEAHADQLFNSAAVIERGRLLGVYRKTHLLEGECVFSPGDSYPTFEVDGLKFGINICFDTNFPETARAVAAQGARLIVCPANNMMPREKAELWRDRHNEIRALRTRETGCWLLSSDVTGERENRVGLGPTAILDPSGTVVDQVPSGQTGLVSFDIPTT